MDPTIKDDHSRDVELNKNNENGTNIEINPLLENVADGETKCTGNNIIKAKVEEVVKVDIDGPKSPAKPISMIKEAVPERQPVKNNDIQIDTPKSELQNIPRNEKDMQQPEVVKSTEQSKPRILPNNSENDVKHPKVQITKLVKAKEPSKTKIPQTATKNSKFIDKLKLKRLKQGNGPKIEMLKKLKLVMALIEKKNQGLEREISKLKSTIAK